MKLSNKLYYKGVFVMNDVMTLNKLDLNQSCIVSKVNSKGVMRRRLMDIGVVPGSVLECVLSSPYGNPRAYLIKGALIALRNDDANLIEVKLI